MDGSAYSNPNYDNSKPYNPTACCGEAKSGMPIDPWRGRATRMRCSTCIWFVIKEMGIRTDPDSRGSIGRCRKHAPTMGGFPVVYTTDWCGDHRLDENKF
mgnify:CR=1 FL=1